MPAPLGGWSLPWRDDFAQANVDSQPTEFGLPTGMNPLTYNPKAASQSLPYADPEGVPNG